MVLLPTPEEFAALQQALIETHRQREEATHRSDSLVGELRLVRTQRDLLQEQLKKFKPQLFAAKSEALELYGAHQKDMFFNEAEDLAAGTAPAVEDSTAADTAADTKLADVPGLLGAQRAKRGRKPLDPALPREVVRHKLPVCERVCPHDGTALQEIGVEAAEQLDIIPQQVRVRSDTSAL